MLPPWRHRRRGESASGRYGVPVSLTGVISTDKLHELAESLAGVRDRPELLADLVAAVDEGRLAEEEDVSFALTLAARLAAEDGDLDRATLLAERAVEAAVGPSDGFAESYLAALYFRQGRDDDAMAMLSGMRPRLVADVAASEHIVEAFRVGGRLAIAEEWLTDAVKNVLPQLDRAMTNDEEEEGAELLGISLVLLDERHEVRRELDLPHDDIDELADDLHDEVEDQLDGAEDEAATVAFFPKGDLEELVARWPDLAEEFGATWDDHRSKVESMMVHMSEGGATGLGVVAGSVEAFVAFAARSSTAPVDAIDDYLGELEDGESPIPWPPERNGPCWCDSGAKYKKCCLPRSRG